MANPSASVAAETDPTTLLAASAEPQHPATQSTIENTPRDPINYDIQETYQAPEPSQTQSPTQENTAPREWGPVMVDEPELPDISNSAGGSRISVTAGRTEIPDSEEAMDYSPVTLSQVARLDAQHAPQSSPTNAGVGANVPEIAVGDAEDGDMSIGAIDDFGHASSSPVALVSSVGGVAIPSETLTRGGGGEGTTASTFPDMAIRSSQSGMESLNMTAERAMEAFKRSTVAPSDVEAEAEPPIGSTGGNRSRLSHPLPSPRTEIPDSDDDSSEDSQIDAEAGADQLAGGGPAVSGLGGTGGDLNTVDDVLNESTHGPQKQSTASDGYDSTQDETQSPSAQKVQNLGVTSNTDESTQDETQPQSLPPAPDTNVTSNANDSTQSASEERAHAQQVAATNEYDSTQDRSEPQSVNSWPTESAPQSAQPQLPDEVDDRTPGSTRGPTPMEIDEPVTLPSQSFHTQDTQVLNSQEMEERISVDDPSQGPTESHLYPAPLYSASADADGQYEQLPATQAISTRYGLGNKTEIKDSQDTQSSGFTDQESSHSSNPSNSNVPGARPVQPPVLPDGQPVQPLSLPVPQPMSPNLPPPAASLKRSAPVDVDEEGEDIVEAEHPAKSAIESSKSLNNEYISPNEQPPATDEEQLPDASPSSNSIQNLSTVADIPPSPSPPQDAYTAVVQSKLKEIQSSHPLSSPSKPVPSSSSGAKQPQAPAGSQSKDILMAELKAMKISSLQARNAALEAEIVSRRAKLEAVTKELTAPAAQTVKKHIKLLHDYNDIRDVGQGLLGMIADNRGGIRVGELYEEFGVDVKD